MAKAFKLSIITPEKIVYEGSITSLVAPSELGYLGVLADHAPLITNLSAGTITVRDDTGKVLFFPSRGKGFLEVLKNDATVFLRAS